jgi:transcriptional regulator with XRE-family HTH domain
MALGQKVSELREQDGFKQRKLAYQLEIGEGFLSKVKGDSTTLKKKI